MLKIIAAASIALVMCGGAAAAADDLLAGFYGNTVISTGGAVESRTHFKADHTFDAVFGGGMFSSKGTWEIKDGKLCRTYDPPIPNVPNPVCVPAEAHKVGDKWTVTVNGDVRQVSLVAGIQ
jgi:hypothetical protein